MRLTSFALVCLVAWAPSLLLAQDAKPVIQAKAAAPAEQKTSATAESFALTVDGKSIAGSIVTATADGQLSLAAPSGDSPGTRQSLPLADLVEWGSPAAAPALPQIWLADGGMLVAGEIDSNGRPSPAKMRIENDQLIAAPTLLGEARVPLEFVRAIMLRTPADRHQRDELLDRLTRATNAVAPGGDRVILANGDEVSGALVDLHADGATLKSSVGELKLALDALAGVAFDPSLGATPKLDGLWSMVGLRDGSRLAARSFTLNETSLELDSPLSADEQPWTMASAAFVYLQARGGRATYLSDLPVESYRHVPFIAAPWPFRLDASATGLPLRAGGRLWLKGIGMHSAARLTLPLDGGYRRFDADVAIDDQTEQRGSVTFRVYVDEKLAYTSEIIRGGMPPVSLSVDVTGGKRLSLLVDFAERGDEMDRADWLNARLVK